MPVGRATVVAAVMRISRQAWFNELVRSTGSRRSARGIVVAVAALLAGWLTLGTWLLGRQIQLDGDAAASIATPVTGVVVTLPALATLLCALYTPSRTVLHDALAVLPIRPTDRRAAVRWLSVCLGIGLGGVWVAPLAIQFVAAGDLATALGAILVCACLALAGALAAQVVLLVFQLVIGRGLRLGGSVVATGMAGLVTALLALWAMLAALPTQGDQAGGGPYSVLAAPLHAVASGAGGAGLLLDLALLLAAIPALGAVLTLLDRVPLPESAGARALGGLLGAGGRGRALPRSLTSLEVRQWLRYPTNAVMLVFILGLSVACLTIWRDSLGDDGWLLGAFFLFTLISTVGVGSYGPTRPAHWIYHLAGRPLAWVAPKLISVAAIWLALLGAYFGLLSLVTSWSPAAGAGLLPMLLVEVAVGCLVGLLLPVNRQQSLGGALSECVAIMIVLSVSVGLQSLPGLRSTAVYLLLCLAVAAAIVGAYVLVARAQAREVRHTGLA